MIDEYVRKILLAHVYDVAHQTPLDAAQRLSKKLDNRVWLKREDLQPVFSFKLRGAYNKMVNLTVGERARGVAAASAGNHAQGVALAARQLGCTARIVMPRTTPQIKVTAVRQLGADVILHGDTYDEACVHARVLAEAEGRVFIHPYDDPDIIAGQGTVGMEVLRQHPSPLHAVFVPVGGGGLIAGIAAYVKNLRPDVRIVGVEPEDAATLHAALAANARVVLETVGIFADGVAVSQIGEETFRLSRQYVDEVVLVNTDEICAAIKDSFDDTRSIAEPAGALAVAGLKKYVGRTGIKNESLVAIQSGSNINFDRLRHVAERAELGEAREALLGVSMPERPGAIRAFCHAIEERAITEFNYRYADPKETHIFAGVQLENGDEDKQALVASLRAQGFVVQDLSDNEVAKSHVRYMVGGHVLQVDDAGGRGFANERLFRCEFPERPGALPRFVNRMNESWNITMFHYRNHGAAYGRVLVGIQVPPAEAGQFLQVLNGLGFTFWEETSNPAYALFLK